MMPTFTELASDYTNLWTTMVVRADKRDAVAAIAERLIAHKAAYQKVEAATGVPWFVVAALHNRESGADFETYLGNGEPLTRKTTLVPKGRGPFASWEAGAIDALRLKNLQGVAAWTAERCCYEIERFNGFGYRNYHPDVKSPYLWSFSGHYRAGKYVADGQFSSTAVDKQCGAVPLIKAIMALDASARFPSARDTAPAAKSGKMPGNTPRKAPEIAAGGAVVVGGGSAYAAQQSGIDVVLVGLIVVFAAVVALGAYLHLRKSRGP
jgi:lysozyme family protein